MGPEERLSLLFAQDEELLKMDTGRRPASESWPVHNTGPQTEDSGNPANEPPATIIQDTAQPTQTAPLGRPSPPELPAPVPEDGIDLQCEHIPSPNGQFSPLLAIAKYPYKHIKGSLSQDVSSRFFDAGKFWNRSWDIYFIHAPASLGSRPVLLTPTSGVNSFFQEINSALKCQLSLPTDTSAGLVLSFEDGYPQPVYLGRSTTREAKDQLELQIPAPSSDHDGSSGDMDEVYAAYETMIEAAIEATRNRKRTSKQKQLMRAVKELDMQQMVRRMHCYFGLRPMEDIEGTTDMGDWDTPGTVPTVQPLDATKAVPYPFWREPVFISIDVESNERCHSQVTEVGVSVLDMQGLVGVPPGENGGQWRKCIQSRHLRVREYGHIVNHEFVSGCPGMFQFGESEWVLQRDLVDVVRSSLRLGDALDRRLVLVGHNLSADVKYLKQVGVDVGGFRDQIDTAQMFRKLRKEESVRSLGGVLAKLNIRGWYLHNAGNDARYTMEVLIASFMGKNEEDAV
ncbi:hypothetical protein AbraIFM66951_009533 [Aspergillus brasiliensis]|uniref:Gfd2/YDR514C-like C-terminal domain-containing protein n=1 Tax=Aspergillus brasiliensis TaxID=319629 RepID=A0A9W6DIT1_9EURO|nr:hypothetical protein AbraCBS73388_002324 [Aspergillus brasiliensis]GKZ41423.1 hypothetical protein AbraIFM66951_009533 [Aspergillus brasiliensis]